MRIVAALLLTSLGAGCVSAPTDLRSEGMSSSPLLSAFTMRVGDLESQSESGNQNAQIALSIVKAEGLRGVARDPVGAETLRRRALAAGAPTQITQYIAGINGAPNRTAIIMVPGRGLSPTAIRGIDECVTHLKTRSAETAAFFPDFSLYDDPKALAAHEEAQAAAARTCGGDEAYGMLSLLWDRARPWGDRALPDCAPGDTRCRVLSDKIVSLNRRDPSAEAHAALMRGDARLGAFNHIGPMPQGWSLPGVDCTKWSRDQIGKWHVNQDVVSPGDSEHTSASVAFIAAYNRAVVTDPAFPWPDVCSETLIKPLDHYPGVVRSWSEAARSGDPTRIREVAASPAVPASNDINARDLLGLTALDWAMQRGDEPMALTLLEAGADPNLNDNDVTQPLALALSQKKLVLAGRMIDRGAQMAGNPRVCERGSPWGPPPDMSVNNGCSWAGLLIRAGAFDLLDAQASTGAIDPPRPRESDYDLGLRASNTVVSIDQLSEIQAALFAAIAAHDETTVARLLPYVGHGTFAPGQVLDQLFAVGRRDLAPAYVLAHGANASKSDAEARVWRAAAEGRQVEAIAFLRDFGADLNLLPTDRLEACTASARTGDISALLTCITEAGERRLQLKAAIETGDLPAFRRLVDQAAGLDERSKLTQLSVAADLGSTAMVKAILDRGAKVDGFYLSPQAKPLYDGALKTQAQGVAAANDYAANIRLGAAPAMRAADRGEREMLRLLVDAGAPNLLGLIQSAGNLGNNPPGLDSSFFTRDTSVDNERLPNRAVDRNFSAFTLLAGEAARAYGPQSLERAFASAAYSGYNDAMEALIAAGLDLSKTTNPQRIWSNWAMLGTPCKPSTGRILVRHRLRADYPPSEETHWPPLHTAAVGCADARAVDVLVREGAMAVNQIDMNGDTPVDLAQRYQRTATVAQLERLGGLPASAAAPAANAERRDRERREEDLDLVQSAER